MKSDKNEACNIRFEYDYVKTALDVVGGKWKAKILWHLRLKPIRFNELMRIIPGVSHKMLIQQLRELEADMILNRIEYDEVPLRVEYSFTNYGKSLCSVFLALEHWGEEHTKVKD
jgi:DNA-binding HxlR family transcriptional regulator